MDYDIIDAGSRPRLQLQSGGQQQDGGIAHQGRSFSLVHAGVCATVGIVSLGLGWSLLAGVGQFLAVWLGLSLVLGPLSPPLLTGGDCRVGVGDPVLPDEEEDLLEHDGGQGGRTNVAKSKEKHIPRPVEVVNGSEYKLGFPQNGGKSNPKHSSQKQIPSRVEEEREWGSEDIDLLKKLMVKHPRGTLRRWEVIAEGLGGKYGTDSVVKMSKALGQTKTGGGDQDAYSQFLSQRKGSDVAIASPLSRRDVEEQQQVADDEMGLVGEQDDLSSSGGGGGGGKGGWTEAEDKALLTALKTFPKESPMRWDKVALAVPGKSKAQCFRRFSDLRKTFRSSVGGGELPAKRTQN